MRRPIGSLRILAGAVTVFALVFCVPETTASGAGGSVARQQPPSRPPRLDPGAASAPYDQEAAARDDERMKMVNEARRKRIPAATEKLVQLTTELKDIVGKSSTEGPPMGAARKAADIEKLARELKNLMQSE